MNDPDVTRSLYSGRTITGHEGADGERIEGWADISYESIRAMNHITGHSYPIPAPVAYRILGNLKGVGAMLPQLLGQLDRGMVASLDTFDVYDHDRAPAESVAQAHELLTQAAGLAEQLGALLSAAQSAIASQGYNTPAATE